MMDALEVLHLREIDSHEREHATAGRYVEFLDMPEIPADAADELLDAMRTLGKSRDAVKKDIASRRELKAASATIARAAAVERSVDEFRDRLDALEEEKRAWNEAWELKHAALLEELEPLHVALHEIAIAKKRRAEIAGAFPHVAVGIAVK